MTTTLEELKKEAKEETAILFGKYYAEKPVTDFVDSLIDRATEIGYSEGFKKASIEESIKRYNQAKEDGTLDKHFPTL